MQYEEYLRALAEPHWVADPLQWEAGNVGIAFLARGGRVGMFNICLLMLDSPEPPPKLLYTQAGIGWALQNAERCELGPRTLEQHAALRTLPDFCMVLQKHPVTKHSKMLTHLLGCGLNRIANDIRSRRIAG